MVCWSVNELVSEVVEVVVEMVDVVVYGFSSHGCNSS